MEEHAIGNIGLVKVCIQVLPDSISFFKLEETTRISVIGLSHSELGRTAADH